MSQENVLSLIYSFIYSFFGQATQLVGSQFSNKVSNPGHSSESSES